MILILNKNLFKMNLNNSEIYNDFLDTKNLDELEYEDSHELLKKWSNKSDELHENIFILMLKLICEKIYIITTRQNYLYLLFIQFNCLIVFQQYFTLTFSLLLTTFILRLIEFCVTKVKNFVKQ